MAKTKEKAEFGDFQTPQTLAQQVCELLRQHIPAPATIIEPTCGIGGLLLAAADAFPEATRVIGGELSPVYAAALQELVAARPDHARLEVRQQDYFTHDWRSNLAGLPVPLLLIGNPPWVTNAELSVLGSDNRPQRYNLHKLNGLDALTGKSNFDISEWMLLDMLRWLPGRDATLAMLVKTAVARKALHYAWKHNLPIHDAAIYQIDAQKHFGAAVDACLLVCSTTLSAAPAPKECLVFPALDSSVPTATLSYRDGLLIADAKHYAQWQHLQGRSPYQWRSGIKHDCAKVMELETTDQPHTYRNGLGETVVLEPTYLFPMLKTSEVANDRVSQPHRRMVVPQQSTGETTDLIRRKAPATWTYLTEHGSLLDGRKSSIYRNRPRFSVFGVGDYSFAPWKVAISGLYKKLFFTVVPPFQGQPVVLDDTTYFLGCASQAEALFLAELLNSAPATGFFSAFIFWDAKRPITVDLLHRLDLKRLAQELGHGAEFTRLTQREEMQMGLFS